MPSLQWPESAQLSMPAEGSCGRATAAQEGRVYMQVAIVDNTGGTKACGLVLQSRHIYMEGAESVPLGVHTLLLRMQCLRG